jgi:hypothetical protein
MEAAKTRTGKEYRKVGGFVLTVTLAALIGGLSTLPARADDDNRGRDQHERSYQPQPSYRSEAPRRYYGNEERRYVYAPPPVYYAPPPRRPVIDFIFPFEFR